MNTGEVLADAVRGRAVLAVPGRGNKAGVSAGNGLRARVRLRLVLRLRVRVRLSACLGAATAAAAGRPSA